MEDEHTLRQWLILIHTKGLGYARVHKVMTALGTENPTDLVHAHTGQLRSAGLSESMVKALVNPNDTAIERDLKWLDSSPANFLLPLSHPAFPETLRATGDPPLALYGIGDASLLSHPHIAMVGSRNPTAGGRRTAREFARFLADIGLGIASGLAEGIDTAAHEGALDAKGITIAVLGTGPDRVYPAVNRDLAHKIVENGALITEFPPGTSPRPGNFPRRNRIIAGLSLGTLVVEAAEKSGSLITARLAGEFGREVLAIPGSIHNPLSRGCHRLIRQGAKLVETAADILEEIGPQLSSVGISSKDSQADSATVEMTDLDDDYRQLLDLMGFDPISVDDLVANSGLPTEAISSMLLMLELRGEVANLPGGRYGRVR